MSTCWAMNRTSSSFRTIVTSRTYRLSSTHRDAAAGNLAGDPDNFYLWKMNPRRMEAEIVRDSPEDRSAGRFFLSEQKRKEPVKGRIALPSRQGRRIQIAVENPFAHK